MRGKTKNDWMGIDREINFALISVCQCQSVDDDPLFFDEWNVSSENNHDDNWNDY
jgi:hypothetical protein